MVRREAWELAYTETKLQGNGPPGECGMDKYGISEVIDQEQNVESTDKNKNRSGGVKR